MRSPSISKFPKHELISIEELSDLWNVPKGTLYNWVSQGRLPHVKLGRLLRFDVSAIDTVRERSTYPEAERNQADSPSRKEI